MYKRHLWLLLVTVGLTACSSGVDEAVSGITAEDNLAVETISGSVKGAMEAVKSPLVDLNITNTEIPTHLQLISGDPYSMPKPLQCKVVKEELAQLDTLLGSDMDNQTAAEDDIDYVEEGASMLQSGAVGFVANKVSIIPFRGIVRRITGAARHEKEYARAYETGKLRRAYLKGWNSALKCDKNTSFAKGKKDLVVAQKDSKAL